ncbi:RelA/SpoT domain-containing protein [Pseudoxanthomonas beigongshangi]|uniref:RelA/SpoT domain-containing protein n=1 Tax=Pseudoxanthomonas beigongshangi TaxID=2782537 RepID=UPI00193B317C|nr:RelA/SpoT domain-containing protein [Pseudoxanthomonas beigongshangi]
MIHNWRAAHAYPLNTFQATLRDKLNRLGIKAVVGQRLKRLPSISAKLRRNENMRLQRMQDIAGIRAIAASMSDVNRLRVNYEKHSRFAHELRGTDDYVAYPKADGYRSVHLKYRYQSERADAFNGLGVEVQIRTRLQHAWATSVETVDTFMGQHIKIGKPNPAWAEFFLLVSAAFAREEREPLPDALRGLAWENLLHRLFELEHDLQVRARLRGFTVAASHITTPERRLAAYHVVVLNMATRHLTVQSFSGREQARAHELYSYEESRTAAGEPIDAVLVPGGTVQQLRKAYPNYFLDTKVFVRKLDDLYRLIQGQRAVKKLRSHLGID